MISMCWYEFSYREFRDAVTPPGSWIESTPLLKKVVRLTRGLKVWFTGLICNGFSCPFS